MKKEHITTAVLILCLIVFVCWQDNERVKQIDKLKLDLEDSQDKIDSLKADNLYLNYKMCEDNKDNSQECEKIRQDVAFRVWLEKRTDEIYKENFGH